MGTNAEGEKEGDKLRILDEINPQILHQLEWLSWGCVEGVLWCKG